METLKFLQIAQLSGNGTWERWMPHLPARTRNRLHAGGEDALRRAADLARAEMVDVLVCAGGLFDDCEVTVEQARKIYGILSSLDPIPVVVIPGELDPLHPFSFHDSRFFLEETGMEHPRNVLIADAADGQWQRSLLSPLSNVQSLPTTGATPLRQPRHQGLLGLISEGIAQTDSLEQVPLDSSALVQVTVSVEPSMTGVPSLADAVIAAARNAGTTSSDLVIASLHGNVAPDLLSEPWRQLEVESSEEWFALIIDCSSLQVYRTDRMFRAGDHNSERKIADCLMRRLLSPADNRTHMETLKTLGIGLQALRSGSVDVPDVD